MQLYIDGRLDPARHARLERHLAACDTCRRDLSLLAMIGDCATEGELVREPADVGEHVMRRIAACEAQRAVSAARELPFGIPRWALSWRSILVALIGLIALALLQPTAFASLSGLAARDASDAIQLLLSPGPDSISWAVWLLGGVVALAITIWFVRADASSAMRRAIAQRLPQLW
jgi:anti-sigma factor RsiW